LGDISGVETGRGGGDWVRVSRVWLERQQRRHGRCRAGDAGGASVVLAVSAERDKV